MNKTKLIISNISLQYYNYVFTRLTIVYKLDYSSSCDLYVGVTLFKVNDLVVYPAQGVGIIETIETKTVGGGACEFYIVRILTNNITLMVPVSNAQNVGLRSLISRTEANNILNKLLESSTEQIHTGQNWNRRFREYSEKLKSRDLNDVVIVLLELLTIGKIKELSFGERRLLEQSISLVTGELSIVLEQKDQTMKEQIMAFWAAIPEVKDSEDKA